MPALDNLSGMQEDVKCAMCRSMARWQAYILRRNAVVQLRLPSVIDGVKADMTMVTWPSLQ
jgi:hypothetical protein